MARLDPRARRAALVALGRELFSRQPYDALSVDEIAARAGIGEGLHYDYLPRKKESYLATLRDTAAELGASFQGGNAPLGLDGFLDFVAHDPEMYRGLVADGLGPNPRFARWSTRCTSRRRAVGGLGPVAWRGGGRCGGRRFSRRHRHHRGARADAPDHSGGASSRRRVDVVVCLPALFHRARAGSAQARGHASRPRARRLGRHGGAGVVPAAVVRGDEPARGGVVGEGYGGGMTRTILLLVGSAALAMREERT
ncbi:MAG: helix-turn-helix transcriptional regulator [Deltaproteobacteria bacterium]|nr:helix-turn-helix transcriptional regulator [Deltaproteobacteria bacterium]